MRAEIDIKALKPDGEIVEFAKYIPNDFNMTENQFETFIKNNASAFAQDACDDNFESLDLVGITDISFDVEEL